MASSGVGRARWGAITVFFVVGFFGATWATRIPAVRANLDLSDGTLALALLGLEGGAVVGLPMGAALVARIGSRRTLRLGFVVFAPALVLVGAAPGVLLLAAALAVMALANSVVDVAMNSQGVELERRAGRSLLSGLHAGHPLGLVGGGLTGAAVAAAHVPVDVHLTVAAVAGLVIALATSRWLAAEPDRGRQPAFARPTRRLLLLGILAFCAFGLDGAAYNWSAIDLRTQHDASDSLAALAFTGFALALVVGRIFGDRLVARHGRVRVVQACAAVAGVGGVAIVAAPGAFLAAAGWALFGVGLSALAPTLLGAAPRTNDAPPAVAIAAVTTVGYLGSFTGPPVIGALAQVSDLSKALLILVGACILLAVLAKPALARIPANLEARSR